MPVTADGFGEVQATPPELDPRRIQQPDVLPPPAGAAFESTVQAVPDDVAARSTWSPACPITLDQLRYVTVTFWGFDGDHHRGELLVHADAAAPLVEVFRALDAARYPIEEMRVVAAPELDLAPTGDGNNTTAFVCRPVRGATSWSQHAYGLAVDVNPFLNPYVKGGLVLPELASAYTDRTRTDPGVLHADDPAVRAFAAIGWGWGGDWSSLKDYQHFSANGR
ncbi:MAG: M15 family metallopeptidase [Acidimicrobiales bacterium]|nr:M15 family metallopeptidase [Acidimicrobiales bacterium]